MRPATRSRARSRGQAMVEFAFIALAFVLLAMGIVDLGRGILYYNMLSNAAREGARVGAVGANTLTQICERVVAEVQAPNLGTASCDSLSDGSTWADGALALTVHRGTAGDPGDPVSVAVTYEFTPVTPVVDFALGLDSGGALPLGASSSMDVEP